MAISRVVTKVPIYPTTLLFGGPDHICALNRLTGETSTLVSRHFGGSFLQIGSCIYHLVLQKFYITGLKRYPILPNWMEMEHWKEELTKPEIENMKGFALASFNITVLFCVGGKKSSQYINSTWMYIIKTDTWTDGPEMLTPRVNHACCTLGSYLYVVAGYNRTDGVVQTVERVNMNICIRGPGMPSQWSKVGVYGYLSRFPTARYLCATANQKSIVIFGGKSGYYGYVTKVGLFCMSKIMCLIEGVNSYNQIYSDRFIVSNDIMMERPSTIQSRELVFHDLVCNVTQIKWVSIICE